MKILTLVATCTVGMAFAGVQEKREMVLSDLSREDCQSKESMKAAKTRLKERGVKVGWKLKKIRKFCGKINGEGTDDNVNVGNFEVDKDFVAVIQNDVNICGNYSRLKTVAKRYGLAYRTAVSTCSYLKRKALLAAGSGNPSAINLEILGGQIDQILDKIYIQRNVYINDLRTRFARSYKPGIDVSAPSPFELLMVVEENPWICIPNEPFAGPSLYGSGSNKVISTVTFKNPLGYRIEDDDGFTYGYANGMELVGNSEDGKILRSIRLEYFCEKEAPADCTDQNKDQRVLLIEESIRNKGLISRLFGWISKLEFNAQEVVYAYLAAKAGRSQTDYLTQNEKDCKGLNLLTGCEMASRYLECVADEEGVMKKFFRTLRSNKNKRLSVASKQKQVQEQVSE